MFAFPQPHEEQMFDCPVVPVTDSPEDMATMLAILFDSSSRYKNDILQFREVSTMLRLGSKYQVEHVRSEAIRRLKICFPDDLSLYATRHTRYRTIEQIHVEAYCLNAPISLIHEDCISVVNFARSFDLPTLLPTALYACAQLPVATLLQGYTGTDGAVYKLSEPDILRCFRSQRLLRDLLFLNYRWILNGPSETCIQRSECRYHMTADMAHLWDTLHFHHDPLIDSGRLWADLPNFGAGRYCRVCSAQFARAYDSQVAGIDWVQLRSYFNLPQPTETQEGQ
ncbi:hypothetical protein EIP91_005106 [Steccherinum ochraceum]|uniref:BTB domain-containing protein n=1 Tax=Steccherinum ochraceum TaxID=92696 RepID=A0A4R0R7Q3_9APHY|nr:hypothetical protein EIP91_005106 [Steccherinum ochraceum]